MQESLAFLGGYGIKAFLVCQDINQLQAHYGREEAITSACHLQCAFAPNRIETAERLSKLTGVTTVTREQVTRNGRGLFSNVSRTVQEHARPLLTPDECRTLPGPRKDAQGLIVEGGDMLIWPGLGSWRKQDGPETSLAPPTPNRNENAAVDVSPAVRDYLGLNGMDTSDWRFVEASPEGD